MVQKKSEQYVDAMKKFGDDVESSCRYVTIFVTHIHTCDKQVRVWIYMYPFVRRVWVCYYYRYLFLPHGQTLACEESCIQPPPSPLPPMRKLLTRSSEQAASEAGPDAGAEAGCGYGAAAVAAEAAPGGAAAARRRQRGVLRAGERAHWRRPPLMGRPA